MQSDGKDSEEIESVSPEVAENDRNTGEEYGEVLERAKENHFGPSLQNVTSDWLDTSLDYPTIKRQEKNRKTKRT